MPRGREGTRLSQRADRRGRSIALAGSLLCLWFAPQAAAQTAPLYTNNPRFRIPFQSDAAEMARIGASEVQLHVSTNGGASWSASQSVTPAEGRFTFEAPGNGAYLFSVRTIDKQGLAHPDGPLQPSLSVVVDDQPPRLKLGVASVSAEDMEAVWQADDEHLDLTTLRLEYLDAATGAWQPLSVGATAIGSTRFPAGTGSVMIRGSVSDLAGNSIAAETTGVSETPARPAGRQTQPGRPDFREPVAGSDAAADAQSLLTGGPRSGANLPMILPNFSQASLAATPTALSSIGSAHISPAPGTMPGGLLPTAPQSLGSPLTPGADHPLLASPPLPADVRRVNTRSFRIGYELQDVGPSGVGSVEIYITEDNGMKWFHYGTDADRVSPLELVVPRDGSYGFSIRVRNGLGVASDPPQPGEPAEIAIVVDQTAPIARLMPLQQGAIGGAYQVRISWFVQDDFLADRPVALYQSESADGPWEPISGWIENQGRYLWTVTSLAPRSIYVRLEARDAAGNLTAAVTPQPLMIDTSRPTARILEVESVGPPSATTH